MHMTDLFNEIINRGYKIRVADVHGDCLNGDEINDLLAAGETTYN